MSALELQSTTRTHSVTLVGASGMMAGEFVRLLQAHPHFGLQRACTRAGGEALHALHPQVRAGQTCVSAAQLGSALLEELKANERPSWLVLALPHGESAPLWGALRSELGGLAEALHVVDLSADHRLECASDYARWYGAEHADPEELARFTYALPELAGQALAGARRLALPGCFATALQLASVPAARAGLLDAESSWVFHASTGSSGSGRQPRAGTHHPHRHANYWGYAREGHRHEAELERALRSLDLAPALTFLPHSGPWARGIHLLAHLPLAGPCSAARAQSIYADAYAGRPFVRVLEGRVPDLHGVVGSNSADLALSVRNGALLVELTLDNLIKGGSGQALQAMNLAAGLAEDTGLPASGLGAL